MKAVRCFTALLIALTLAATAFAQAVCLPAPRLLTTKPMGGRVGTTLQLSITGDNLDGADKLSFSHPGITAQPKVDGSGNPVPNQYVVTIAADCPVGVHEARVLTRLGVSSSRAFSVGNLPEITQSKSNATLQDAVQVPTNGICNAVMTKRAVDHYRFQSKKGQRIIIDCAAQGIDSKLKPVLVVADADGADLQVERRGGAIDFEAPATGDFVVKVHDLTYNGGPEYFYRLAIREAEKDAPLIRLPSTRRVSACSWPPVGLAAAAAQQESEPNNLDEQAEKISVPCDIAGKFYPAADVDTFEFTAKKGETWWVEVASERLGRSTDPVVIVQRVVDTNGKQTVVDVAELNDIASPVKVSSNGYSYDGPPYNAGSSDVLGQFKVEEDGIHRLKIRDLFGGTRSDPNNVYRLIVRKAKPDFALAGWALHMNLRNGDRNALSKPIALRGGATMPLEIVVIRRDGFSGAIDLEMSELPPGVTAAGLRIPAGRNRGIVLVSAANNAPPGLSSAKLVGKASIGDESLTRECRFASMKWPVPDASREIPAPRLLADIPVSVCDAELAPITIAAEDKIWDAKVGGKLTIPLQHVRRCEFSGSNISLKTYGSGFESNAAFDASLQDDQSAAEIDLAKLKTPPGDYVIAFYGSAVAKYRYHPEAVEVAKLALDAAKKRASLSAAESVRLAQEAKTASGGAKQEAAKAAQLARRKMMADQAAVKTAEAKLRTVTARAQPKDIVDIVVSTPIRIRVSPAEQP